MPAAVVPPLLVTRVRSARGVSGESASNAPDPATVWRTIVNACARSNPSCSAASSIPSAR